ncbi:MAG: DUF3788 family protein [Verrucomicrobiia bacterium]
MTTNAFIGKTDQPTSADLDSALGPTRALWDAWLAELARDCQADICEWKCYSPKMGWSMRVKRKQRTIVWLAPAAGSFTLLFILGEKAVQAARESGLGKRAWTMLEKAPRYPEGRGVRFDVKRPGDLALARKLAQVKLRN